MRVKHKTHTGKIEKIRAHDISHAHPNQRVEPFAGERSLAASLIAAAVGPDYGPAGIFTSL